MGLILEGKLKCPVQWVSGPEGRLRSMGRAQAPSLGLHPAHVP